ncbi:tetratricopeptide repeat protein [Wukongibacter baidiensis]|uniref:tetratricopeptide repeat protein n=1 Tax=Wukongibacter baidiensis TaxID=1723361 RepID=UPI003D7F29CE
MKKFNLSHIKILSPEEQVEEKIIERFGDVDSFAKQINMDTKTVYQYLKELEQGSNLFKDKLCEALNMKSDELIKSDKEQIKNMVQSISDNLQTYQGNEDLYILNALKVLCVDNNLKVEALVMQRNIAMYYFYTGITNRAVGAMENTISLVKDRDLLIKWKSELGLMYFSQCNYEKSRKVHEEVEKLLNKANRVDKRTKYLHYYRYGLLESNTSNYLSAERLFEKSLEYVKSSTDKGDSIVNIGLSYKRRGDYQEAIGHYNKALDVFEEGVNKSKAYNNLAELYKCLGEYDKALLYIQKAFDNMDKNNITRHFLYYQTYAQIQILKGDHEKVVSKLYELVMGMEDHFVYDQVKIKGIRTLIDYCIKTDDIDMLEHVRDFLISLIEKKTEDDEEYLNVLYGFIGEIRLHTR